MPNKKNIETVAFLKEKIDACAGLVFFDYRGMSVFQLSSLRRELSKSDSALVVCKNSLVNIALKSLGRDVEADMFLNPTAVVFANTDVPAAAKAVSEAAKKNDKIKIKGGYMGADLLLSAQVQIVANIPSRDVLLSHLVAALEGPISGFVYAGGAVVSSLAYTLAAVEEKKEPA